MRPVRSSSFPWGTAEGREDTNCHGSRRGHAPSAATVPDVSWPARRFSSIPELSDLLARRDRRDAGAPGRAGRGRTRPHYPTDMAIEA